MISQNTINQVYDLDIVQVIHGYIKDLKKKGATFVAKSPFNDEKSGSFHVSPAKNIWKCFSSGKGGAGHISFVINYKNISFPEAIREIATDHNIEIVYDESDDTKKYAIKREKQLAIADINSMALHYFQYQLEKAIQKKKITREEVRCMPSDQEHYGIGLALDSFRDLFDYLISKGANEDAIIAAGLAKRKEDKVFDLFINRIIFPIYNRQNMLVGFSGRKLSKDDKFPKYINTPQTDLFDKSKSFIGINVARNQIIKFGHVCLVEGNYDVIAANKAYKDQSVSPCGTSLTREHLKELKKLKVKKATIIFDGDTAGIKAAIRSIDYLVQEDINPRIIILPDDQDPDEYMKAKGNSPETFRNLEQDAIIWYAEYLNENAKSISDQAEAQSKIEQLLSCMISENMRKLYIKEISTKSKINKGDLEKGVKSKIKYIASESEDDLYKFPGSPTKEEKKDFEQQVRKFRFYEDQRKKHIGYWFLKESGHFDMCSNFVVKPLFHVFSHTNNRRLVSITTKDKTSIIEVASERFVNSAEFEAECLKHLPAIWLGASKQFKLLQLKFLDQMPRADEVTVLGFQPKDKFFAFANGVVYNGIFKKVDDYGIVTLGKEDEHYFLPAFSSIYRELKEQEDPYSADKDLKYRPSNISWSEWSQQYLKVNGDNGMYGIAFFLASMFSDYIHSVLDYFPILWNFGQVQTGKSEACRGINNICLAGSSAFNLYSSTHTSMQRKLAQYRNVPVWMDEYSNDIEEIKFQILKAIWDRTAREKGRATATSKTQRDLILQPAQVSTQYIPTRDDNSLLTRLVLCTFDRKAAERTEEEIKNLSKLKSMENKGLSHLVAEVIKFREFIEENFEDTFFDTVKSMKLEFEKMKAIFDGRVMNNFAVLMTIFKLLEKKLTMPFTYKEFYELSIDRIQTQSDYITDSDILQSYWKMIEFLFLQHMITFGHDFDIKTTNHVRLNKKGGGSKIEDFGADKRLLFIQFTRIHPLYMKAHKEQHGQMGTNEKSIQSYMKSHKSFIGITPTHQFRNRRTSAYVFDYTMVNVNLEESMAPNAPSKPQVPEKNDIDPKHRPAETKQEDIPFD